MPDLKINHLIFDGQCSFCRSCVSLITEANPSISFKSSPYQDVLSEYPQIDEKKFSESVHLSLSSGEMLSGAHAIFYLLKNKVPYSFLYFSYIKIKIIRTFFDFLYSWVSSNRVLCSNFLKKGLSFEAYLSKFQISSFIFLKFLALIYFFSFYSLNKENFGLFSSQGLAPIQELITFLKNQTTNMSFWDFPSLFWFNSSDFFISLVPKLGMILSIILFLKPNFKFLFFLLFISYLSFMLTGREFTSFQWDALLLETTFASFFLVRRGKNSWGGIGVILLQGVWFKLILSSGLVKILANTSSWRNLSALMVHFETQPLPNFIAPYFHFLPVPFLKTLCAMTIILQIALPLFFFMGKKARSIAFSLHLIFQLMIMLTVN